MVKIIVLTIILSVIGCATTAPIIKGTTDHIFLIKASKQTGVQYPIANFGITAIDCNRVAIDINLYSKDSDKFNYWCAGKSEYYNNARMNALFQEFGL